MLKFIGKRLLQGIFVIVGLSMLIFIISRLVPGDPARLALGPRASQEAVDLLRQELYLDEPLPKQYVLWLRDVFQGDLGDSLVTKRPVAMDVAQFLPATLELALFSALIMVVFSLLFGLFSAKYKNKAPDTVIRIFAYIGVAVPSFVMAVLLLLLFGYVWKVIPVIGRLSTGVAAPATITGFYTIDSLLTGNFRTAWDAMLHLLLPALALAIGPLFQEARILRSSLVDNMSKEHISVSTGYGLPGGLLMRKYLFKSSFGPVINVMGLDFASMIGNAFLVETIFNWPGLSRYGINAMLYKDLNAISAVIIIIGLVFLVVNLIVDILSAYVDPRIHLG